MISLLSCSNLTDASNSSLIGINPAWRFFPQQRPGSTLTMRKSVKGQRKSKVNRQKHCGEKGDAERAQSTQPLSALAHLGQMPVKVPTRRGGGQSDAAPAAAQSQAELRRRSRIAGILRLQLR